MPPFSETLKNLRSERGLTISDMSARTGVSRATLHQLESGRNGPTLATLEKIAGGLNIPLEDLVGRKEVPLC